MNTFIIPAHGVAYAANSHLSYAQDRLLAEPKPIRLCSAPTGAGKTYAFIEAARQRQAVFFVVPTQTLADDLKQSVDDYNSTYSLTQPIHTAIWDGRQSLQAVQEGKLSWAERLADFQSIQTHGGMIIATLEALARLTMGFAELQHIQFNMIDLLWRCHHLVIDESHTLNTRAFGLLHLWITAIAFDSKQRHQAPKLTLLSATHSNLLKDLLEEEYLPSEYIEIFDEHVSEAPDCRLIHGEVTVRVHDDDLAAVVAAHAKTLLRDKGKVLVVYDSLIQLRRDTRRLQQIFCQDCGVDPQHIIMINGQDRQVEQASGSEEAFATGTRPQSHHRVIIGTSAVGMGVNFHVDAAIIEPGQDAAALLQLIGRVARGRQPGIVHISKPQQEVPNHFIRLQQCQGSIPINNLRETFEPLRLFNTKRAKELGRAYWSMLGRRDRHLMAGLKEAFIEIMGDDAAVPGRLLDSLWTAERRTFRDRCFFMEWLKAIDRTLQDVRGFAPTVKLRFQDSCFTYSRDWVTKYLRPPDHYDLAEETYVYHDELERCLREQAQPLECRFFYPQGKTELIRTWSVPSPDLWKRYRLQYLNPRRYPSKPEIRQFYERAALFIELTGLMPRADGMEGEIIDSDII
jgi:hypothetical protein